MNPSQTHPAEAVRLLTEVELADALKHLPNWRLDEAEPACLVRICRTADWPRTLLLAGLVAHLAEVGWHHPELRLQYSTLEIRLNTHEVNGITARDTALAQQIDEVLGWQPAADGGQALTGLPPGQPYFRAA
ncbi:4a-hydroxytetrahydrobiopterin dehydratase [Ideonella margarita]|uniref:4a-hydroxytetrahydrobiopterin dehydratase n=1 Tax=Ideonella margarita TaxID=2984191 RepID=A0ABU9C242_9BURK